MSHTRRKQRHKFDDEQYSGRAGKHAKHTNNHKFHGIPYTSIIINEKNLDLSDERVESDDK